MLHPVRSKLIENHLFHTKIVIILIDIDFTVEHSTDRS